MRTVTYGGTVPFATFQDLWLEASDPTRVTRFWADALGLEVEAFGEGGYRARGRRPEPTLYVVPSSPGSLGGFRIHVELCAADLAELRRLDDSTAEHDADEPWLELNGPEASQLRCFPSLEPFEERRYEVVLAAAQPARAARWWARVLGAVHESAAGGDYAWVTHVPNAPFDTLLFTREMSAERPQRVRMRLVTTDLAALIRYGAAMVAGRDAMPGSPEDARVPAHHMKCAEGIEFVLLDVSGSPEAARIAQPAKPVMGPR